MDQMRLLSGQNPHFHDGDTGLRKSLALLKHIFETLLAACWRGIIIELIFKGNR